MKPEPKVAVSKDWEDNCASVGQSKCECVNPQLDDEIIDTDVVIGPGGEVDNLNWLYHVNNADLCTLKENLSTKQTREILGHQKIVQELLAPYNIDTTTAQGWEYEGICLQDVLK
ncbi:hypothetical protein DSO57_1028531 [Entomophthora muscae]|uniref:Uncharacterized protein n=1 Tax=Entomophthora muscae TaxID=34485 RepID=A0ACC2TZZ7_9FUNG|nr:hypothetical protein DSO57_1028531 [Entomophthora muscae]